MFRYLAITEQSRCPEPLTGRIRTLIDLNLPAIQIRDKSRTDRDRFEIACDSIGYGGKTTIIINGRADIARLSGADGVHRAGRGLLTRSLRNLLPSGSIVGWSAHSPEEARRAEVQQADYVCYGPVAPTPSKPGLSREDCVGVSGIGRVSRAVDLPVLALGGITPKLARRCREAGAYGAAGIGWLMDTREPKRRWQLMREALAC